LTPHREERLGVNHHMIPVDASRRPFHSYQGDGARMTIITRSPDFYSA
jgi:catalase